MKMYSSLVKLSYYRTLDCATIPKMLCVKCENIQNQQLVLTLVANVATIDINQGQKVTEKAVFWIVTGKAGKTGFYKLISMCTVDL